MDRAHFEDAEFVKRYGKGTGQFCPGYEIMQLMAAQLIAEKVGVQGDVLILGAGGGAEVEVFHRAQPGWRFAGVDPAEQMLVAAKLRAEKCGADVRWTRGYIFDAPSGPFDAATALLTLHFAADDGEKLRTLQAIRQRLAPGAPFVMVNLCIDKAAPDWALHVERYNRWALNAGADPEDVAATVERVRSVIHTVSPERDVALLAEAGFGNTQLFYAALSWRGWISYA